MGTHLQLYSNNDTIIYYTIIVVDTNFTQIAAYIALIRQRKSSETHPLVLSVPSILPVPYIISRRGERVAGSTNSELSLLNFRL